MIFQKQLQNCPKISVVTPSFNQSKYIEKTIQSVLLQEYQNIEYIIMDGGSSDGSVDIIKKYESRLKYWQSQSDKGQADAISQGFKLATGDIFAWINSDDFYCQNSFQKVAKTFIKYPSLGLIYGDSFLVNEQAELTRALIASPMNYKQWLYGTSSVFQGSVFFSRFAYESVCGIDSTLEYAMEYKLFFNIAKQFQTVHIPEFLACFRQQPRQKSATISHIGLSEFKNILLELENLNTESWSYRSTTHFLRLLRRLKYIKNGWFLNRSQYSKIFQKVTTF
ncbi:glycosyltransferase family 2 protein [Synechocystis salina]|uniref:Glycosyltransferase n=1 Tax=Synechocystis salina LEGE 00031 TaxID=1828736 RepID=A0ABR9VRW5_9SYNC|nr:glycosyltransferase family 2 protein [Synechocystis salina]MBE9241024.1 glycosyltransferase [Synechocystis salina LEGE 00041]MBE9254070.1 glycosyltransferase [Synechocystis salina LEGE 00031]